MQNLKEIRKRIASVKSTKQITQAMKMVAAAKLRKVQNRVIQLRPYTNKLQEVLGHIVDALESIEDPLFEQRPVKKVLIVAISSNRGLCGAFNINVVKEVQQIVDNYKKQGIQADIIGVGRKAAIILEKRGYNVVSSENSYIDDISYENSKKLANQLLEKYLKGEYDKIEIIRNSFKSAGSQIITKEQFLPIPKPQTNNKSYRAFYIFDPDIHQILKELIYNKLLFTEIFFSLLDSYSAEQAARMTAMHKATDNATELIRQLTLTYNKARQAAITKEILEVVNGAEALKNR